VTKKSDSTAKLLEKIVPLYPAPEPLPGVNLVQQGMYATLLHKLSPAEAKSALATLTKAYSDWNELRVAQAQEINTHLDLGPKGIKVAADVRDYLQEVFQRSHGMDLEFLRDDAGSTQRFVSILPFMGMSTAHYLLWLASDKDLPVTPALVRVLDRIGLVPRTASIKKARTSIVPLIEKGNELEFAYKFGEVATRWCDARKPLCYQCVLVDDCKFGKKNFRDWKLQQERLEVQRARDAARQAILQKKEDERRRKEAERQRKREALEAAKRAREAERLARIDAKKKAIADAKAAKLKAALAAKAAKEAARQKALAEAAARKAAAEKKKLEAKKAAEKKKKADVAKKVAAAKAKARQAARAKAKKPSRSKKA
jgi:endonuclease III